MFGDMVFEATRTFNQKPYRLREHLDRLYASMRYAEIDCGLTIDQMKAATHETIERQSAGARRLGLADHARCDPWSAAAL